MLDLLKESGWTEFGGLSHDGKIYFCTSQDIPPENELLFYYSRDYAQQIGKFIYKTCLSWI